MKEILVVGMGGFIGASFRHVISMWTLQFFKAGFPFGTFFVNVVGCFLIGFFFSLGFDRNTELPLKEFIHADCPHFWKYGKKRYGIWSRQFMSNFDITIFSLVWIRM